MNPDLSFHWLDLHRLSDYALDAAELLPLMHTLADDLGRQIQALDASLAHGEGPQALHPQLHALKGMAGMFAVPALLEAITRADNACRLGQTAPGVSLAREVRPRLDLWLTEVRGWLQRYS